MRWANGYLDWWRREWAYALFTRDAPEEQSNATTAYFVAVMTALAMILWLVPGQGNGLR